MKTKSFIKHIIGLTLVFLMTLSFAAPALGETPSEILKKLADKMVAQLSANQSQLQKDPSIVRHIVETVLVPDIDTNRMAGLVVGRNAWRSASSSERREFVKQFKLVVIATYSDALASFDDDKVVIYPPRQSFEDKKYAQVTSAILRKSGQKIAISYDLISTTDKNTGKNVWRIYDFSIEGVSIVQNYRAQFASTLANGGMKRLITQLQQYNQSR